MTITKAEDCRILNDTECRQCGKPLSVFEADRCSECKDPLRQMHNQIKQLIKRIDKIEATGYIYPKTLPADAVIVIRTTERLSDSMSAFVMGLFMETWPENKAIILAPGTSMEVYESNADEQSEKDS